MFQEESILKKQVKNKTKNTKVLKMKKSIKNILIVFFLVTSLVACNQGETLQGFYIASQNNPSFISVDIPMSFMDVNKVELTEDQKDAYETIDKLNLLGYKLTDSNNAEYKTELSKIRTILKNEKYQDLFRGGNNTDGKVVVKYIGSDSTIDELIVLGTMNDKGFAVVRVLGDNMEPAKIMKLGDAVSKFNDEENQMKEFLEFFN